LLVWLEELAIVLTVSVSFLGLNCYEKFAQIIIFDLNIFDNNLMLLREFFHYFIFISRINEIDDTSFLLDLIIFKTFSYFPFIVLQRAND
jgi:hypothetical protein